MEAIATAPAGREPGGYVELTPSDLRELANAASNIAIQGERYPEELERRKGL